VQEFIQHIINGVYLGGTYALIALGYTMVYGVLRLINFAHGDVFMVGAYAGFFASVVVGVSGAASWWGVILVFLIGMTLCAGMGMLIERVAYRPLRGAPRLASLITAIGISLLLEYGGQSPPLFKYGKAQFPFGPTPQSFPELVSRSNLFPPSAGLSFTWVQLLTVLTTLALMAGLELVVTRTRIGKAMRATSVDRDAACLMGVNVDRVILFTFALGSALAAAAGIMFAMDKGQIDPLIGLLIGLKAFVAAVLGGIGNIPGAMAGGFLLGLLEEMVAGYGRFIGFPSTARDAVAFGILILILLVRPAGLFGRSVPEKV
jgi:branched-chain amino acid transport system permease protein